MNAIIAQLFKVLVNGASCSGGTMTWSLPENGKPGNWHEVDGELHLCRRGLHLTDDPARWWKPECKVYTVEAEGIEGDCAGTPDRKVVARRVRLMREVTQSELTALRIFSEGQHTVKGEQVAIALGSSSVEAWGSSSVVARESSRVEAWGSSSVEARESSSVVARESSRVEAWGSSSVEAWESSRVEAWGSSRVEGSSDVTIVSWKGRQGIKVLERAVCVVRDGDAPPEIMLAKAKVKAKKRPPAKPKPSRGSKGVV